MTDEKNKTITFKGEEKIRLDVFLSSQFEDVTRGKIQNMIRDGKITLNEEIVKPRTILKQGDAIFADLDIEDESFQIEPQADLPIEIISENKDFIVIKKPTGISVHPSEHEKKGTVVNWLLARFPQVKGIGENDMRPGIVHRLDKETSGLLVIALKQEAFLFLKEAFKNREVKKSYQALCWGIPKNESGSIETFIGKSKSNPTKQATSANQEKLINPKTAHTEYITLKNSAEMSLLEIDLKTGRKHQIRIHLQSIGHPIVGDKVYFTKETKKRNIHSSRMFLHAFSLSFTYLDGKSYDFKCPPESSFSPRWR